jgi:hypothetical protein
MDPINQNSSLIPSPSSQSAPPVGPRKSKDWIWSVVLGAIIVFLVLVIVYLVSQDDSNDHIINLNTNPGQSQDVSPVNTNPAPAANNSTPDTSPPSSGGTSPKTTTPANPAPAPASNPVATVGEFKGEWNGTYTPNVWSKCKNPGEVSFSISSTGSAVGYIVISAAKIPGTGTVDNSGNLSGSWNYTGNNLTYSGTLNYKTNTGTGSFRNSLNCFGTFSVKR